jgi:hypothetical protein
MSSYDREDQPSKRRRVEQGRDVDVCAAFAPWARSSASIDPSIAHLVQSSARSDSNTPSVQPRSRALHSIYGNDHLAQLLPESGYTIFSPGATSVSSDDYAANPRFLELQKELRNILFTGAQSDVASRATTPHLRHTGVSEENARSRQATRTIICNRARLRYLKNYIDKVAPWLDMFDARRYHGVRIPLIAQHSPALLYAMLALSARHLERTNALRRSGESLELYQHAIGLLTPMLEARDPNALVTSCLLCCLEMMSASPQNWRRHLEGCAAIFTSFQANGFGGGLLQAVFWCYARMDLSQAMISDGMEATVLPVENWIPAGTSTAEAASLFALSRSPDMHANYAVYLGARTCALLAERTRATEFQVDNGCVGQGYVRKWQGLWSEIQRWFADRPEELLPVKTVNATRETMFPRILFAHWAAISSNQLMHASSILLLKVKPLSKESDNNQSASPLWHARRVVGISESNLHEGCLNNALQSLWIAGKLLTHRKEHLLVIGLIRSIEARTGWAMSWRCADLEEIWGYEPSELIRQATSGAQDER